MNNNELKEILSNHKKWLNGEEGGERADLSMTDLREANLSYAILRSADLAGANLDYSCWPLWCGSLRAQIDDRIACQLIYHVCSSILHSPEVSDGVKKVMLSDEVLGIANKFHRVDECGELLF